MRFALVCTAALVLAVLAGSGLSQNKNDPYAAHIAATPPRTPAEEQKLFHLPPGFEIQLVAAEPDLHKPINMNFDDRGRLWVTDSIEYPYPARNGKPRDAVKILEDFADDGRARKITTFADELNIPIGVLPLADGALVYSIPNIYRLTGTDGHGKADKRDVLYGSYGFRDTHGMTGSFTWGFDGWIYACHGFSNTSTIQGADKSAVTMQSGNIYRMKVDGSHVEQFTHGQVNPFGLTFDPLGNLYSADCHTQPIMMLLRNGWYQSFGKPHDGLGFAPEIIDRYDDSTAIAGITYYTADHFPPAFRDQVYIGDVVTHNIVQFSLEWNGSSPRAGLHYFLKCDDPWFRPVDIKLGPDGALYVADFYNRIIGHYEVPLDHPGRDRERGRIWRIVYKGEGAGKLTSPGELSALSAPELVALLGHPNLTVRMKATNLLVQRGGNASALVKAVMQAPKSKAEQRMHGLWVLERREALDDATLTDAARDRERGVRVHAMRVLSERKQLSAMQRDLVLAGLKDADPFVQRRAADALGQHPAASNLRPLLDLRQTVPSADAQLVHTVRMALRDQLRPATGWAHLPATLSEQDAHAVADVATGVPSAEAAGFLFQHIQHYAEDDEKLLRYVHHIARYGTSDVDTTLTGYSRSHRAGDLDHQVALFREIARGTEERGGKLSEPARAWAADLTARLLESRDTKRVQAGLELVGSLKLTALQGTLVAMAGARQTPEAQRLAALNALVAVAPHDSIAYLGRLLSDAAEPIGLREQSANALARLNQPDAQEQLVKCLPAAPARLQNVIALGLAASRTGAEKLLDAVAAGKASARLLQERPVELRLADAKVPNLKERLAKLTSGLPSVDQRANELIQRRRVGFSAVRTDAEAGARIFEKNCAICHQLGGKGAKFGPQLDGIGSRGVDRLLEDILDPNRNVDQAFRSTILNMKNGQVITGLLLKEEGEVLVMIDGQGKEVRVPQKSVDEKSQSQLSPMPSSFAEQVSEAEFYNLIAFLLRQQAPPNGK